jgi:hypothetical protein
MLRRLGERIMEPTFQLFLTVYACVAAIIIIVMSYQGWDFHSCMMLALIWPMIAVIGIIASPFYIFFWLGKCIKQRRVIDIRKMIKNNT